MEALPAGELGLQHGGHDFRLPAEMLERFPRQRIHADRAK